VPRVGSLLQVKVGAQQHYQKYTSAWSPGQSVPQHHVSFTDDVTNMELPADDRPMVITRCAGRANKSLAVARHSKALRWRISNAYPD